jgi:hypothetical protein
MVNIFFLWGNLRFVGGVWYGVVLAAGQRGLDESAGGEILGFAVFERLAQVWDEIWVVYLG